MVGKVPYVPEYITVHLGTPDSNAPNITIPFADYIKNVASSEIYPTWPESAIRANIYAQLSYTLNRIYTEWYPSKGYDFDITSSTQFDHSFVKDRDIFDNISRIVDDIFDSYIRMKGQVEPYISPYCDGIRTQCAGLKQWDTVALANQGYNSFEILQNFYGDNIELVQNVPVQTITPSYPGYPLKYDDFGNNVRIIQNQLNRISTNYPSIPKISPVSGEFNKVTESAVKEFQRIFNLTPDGIVGKGTWYQISYIYTVVKNLAEIESEGIKYGFETIQYPTELKPGSSETGVTLLQYFLSVIGKFDPEVPPVQITGVYDDQTQEGIKAIQQINGLPVNGLLDPQTWNTIYQDFESILKVIPGIEGDYPIIPYGGIPLKQGMSGKSVEDLQNYINVISTVYKEIPSVDAIGIFGSDTRGAVVNFQKSFGLTPDGIVGEQTWQEILSAYESVLLANNPNVPQFPGYSLKEGIVD